MYIHVNGIGAVVKVVDFHICGWDAFPGKNGSFLIVSLSKSLSLCSDQHVKYRMPRGFPLTSCLLLDYHSKQYIHVHTVNVHINLYAYIHREQVKKIKDWEPNSCTDHW